MFRPRVGFFPTGTRPVWSTKSSVDNWLKSPTIVIYASGLLHCISSTASCNTNNKSSALYTGFVGWYTQHVNTSPPLNVCVTHKNSTSSTTLHAVHILGFNVVLTYVIINILQYNKDPLQRIHLEHVGDVNLRSVLYAFAYVCYLEIANWTWIMPPIKLCNRANLFQISLESSLQNSRRLKKALEASSGRTCISRHNWHLHVDKYFEQARKHWKINQNNIK